MLVLRARGVESEAEIPFAGLHALLRPAFDRLDALPQPQAAALRGGARAGAGRRRRAVPDRGGDAEPARRARRGAPGAGRRRRRAVARRVLLRRDPVRRAPPVRRHGRDRDRHAHADGGDLPTLRSKASTATRRPRCSSRHAGGPLPPGAADRLFEVTLGNPLALVELAAATAARRRPAAGGGDEHRAHLRAQDRRAARAGAAAAGAGRGRGLGRARGARTGGVGARARLHRAGRGRARAAGHRHRPISSRSVIRWRARRPTARRRRTSGAPRTARSRPPTRTPTGAPGIAPRRRSGPTTRPRASSRPPRPVLAIARRLHGRRQLLRARRAAHQRPPGPRTAPVRGGGGGVAGRPYRPRERAAGGGPRGVRGPCAEARDRPPARTRGVALGPGDGRARDPRRGGRGGAARTGRGAAGRGLRGVLLRRAARTDAAHGARRAGGDAGAARRARALLRRAVVRDGAHLHGRGRAGRRLAAGGDGRARALGRAVGRPAAAVLGGDGPAVAARGRAGARARGPRDRVGPRDGRHRRAALRALARGPRRGDVGPPRGRGRALRGGDPARARDRAGDARCAPAWPGWPASRPSRAPRPPAASTRGGARAHRRARAGLLPAVGAGRDGRRSSSVSATSSAPSSG